MAPKASAATINTQTGTISLRQVASTAQGHGSSGNPAQSSSSFSAGWTTAPRITEEFIRSIQAPLLVGLVVETFSPSPRPLRKLWQIQSTIHPGPSVPMPGSSGSVWRLLETKEGYTPSAKITQYNTVVRRDGMPIRLLAETGNYFDSRKSGDMAFVRARPQNAGPVSSNFAAAWQSACYVDRPYLSLLQQTIPKDTYVETSRPPTTEKPPVRNLWIARQNIDPGRMPGGHIPLPWLSNTHWMHVESLYGPTPREKLKACYQRREFLDQQRRQAAHAESIRKREANFTRLQRTKSEDRLRLGMRPEDRSRRQAWKPFDKDAEPRGNPYRSQSIPNLSRYAGSAWSIPTM